MEFSIVYEEIVRDSMEEETKWNFFICKLSEDAQVYGKNTRVAKSDHLDKYLHVWFLQKGCEDDTVSSKVEASRQINVVKKGILKYGPYNHQPKHFDNEGIMETFRYGDEENYDIKWLRGEEKLQVLRDRCKEVSLEK
ncbi:hypothetical protein Trydic_g1398 [Trypoxylus dichotomus]